MKRISQERICQELVKAYEQAKNFSQYLEFFNEFDMWGEIFPGLKINTEIKDSKYIETYFANLFKFVDSSKLLFKLKMENY
jgi:tRNA nucleotidyltransferase/poly(A) polymerase